MGALVLSFKTFLSIKKCPILALSILSFRSITMSLNVKLRRMRKKPPAGWEIVEPTLEEFEAKMREAETDPHEGKRKSESVWPIFRVSFL